MAKDPFFGDPEYRDAAAYAETIHKRDARAEYIKRGLSEAAVNELLEKRYLKPAHLFEGHFTEDYMQRDLSADTFGEIYRLRHT